MTGTSERVKGHALRYGWCECGELKPAESSDRHRTAYQQHEALKAWHREHKAEVLAAREVGA